MDLSKVTQTELQADFRPYALHIWRLGECTSDAQFCFIPNDCGGYDDPIIDKYDVTHYDYVWNEIGQTVKVRLYRNDSYGRATHNKLWHTFICDVQMHVII